MNGSNSIIKVGTKDNDKIIGNAKDKFKFLKNSISSNKLSNIPNEINIKIVLIKILENFIIKYLLITLFIW